ncbi:FAD binding domain-containing protein [Actinophytocola sp.]|jgi:hypothetical protein|uniref:FAD binding domain-containing protein n=1 Tax=Actinophytocola sp. TaxID=1872138 RepID=UPI002ED8BB93
MKDFGYVRPTDVATALRAIDEQPNAKFLGGGTNLVDLMRERIEAPDTLVDLTRLPLTGIDEQPDGTLRMNANLAEYHVPVHADVPPIDVSCLDDPDPTMPLGVLGAGEVGITGVGGAVANAVFHATGRRIYDLPITLDKLL